MNVLIEANGAGKFNPLSLFKLLNFTMSGRLQFNAQLSDFLRPAGWTMSESSSSQRSVRIDAVIEIDVLNKNSQKAIAAVSRVLDEMEF